MTECERIIKHGIHPEDLFSKIIHIKDDTSKSEYIKAKKRFL